MSSDAPLSISAVSKRTGIPISTLRYYERELSGLFQIRKTAGGHRRYGESDVERFAMIRRLTETEGLGLAEVRRAVMSRGDSEGLRERLDRLAEAHTVTAGAIEALSRRLAELEARLAGLPAAPPRRRLWLSRRDT